MCERAAPMKCSHIQTNTVNNLYRCNTYLSKTQTYLELLSIIIYFIFRDSFYISFDGFLGGW